MDHRRVRSKARSPFTGKPRTWALSRGKGKASGYRIKAAFLTPLRARIADNTAILAALCIGLYGCARALSLPTGQFEHLALALVYALISYPAGLGLLRWLLRKTRHIEITPDEVRISGSLGWKTYDRRIKHRFHLLPHDKARAERDRHDYLARKGQTKRSIRRLKKYYQESWHVVFEYLGQRVDIADVYGLPPARAILARLKACDEIMDGKPGTGLGRVLTPEDEWASSPGDIPL